MFDCDISADFFSWSEPVARKKHGCCECSAPILKGEKHYHGRGKWDGRIDDCRQHFLCMEACMLVRDKINLDCIPFGSLMEWYGEYRNDIRDQEAGRQLMRMMVKIRRREREAKGERQYAG